MTTKSLNRLLDYRIRGGLHQTWFPARKPAMTIEQCVKSIKPNDQ